MTTTVGEMTAGELQEMIELVIEQKLRELLGDPDEGLELRDEIAVRLRKQQTAVNYGDRGNSLEDVARQLGLD